MNIGQLQRDFMQRASAAGLKVECMGDGDADADTIIVAEAPGENEVRMRTPLVGGSGKFLWDTLRKFGIQRRHCYVTNVVKRQLVGADAKEKVPANELAHWHGLLEWELAQLRNAKYVLVLGNYALEALTGRHGVDNWRGSVIQLEDKHYIITNNPAAIIRAPQMELWFNHDLMKLDMVRRGKWREHNIVPYIDPSPSDVLAYIGRLLDERRPIAFDIETIAGETACVGLANDPHAGMCVNFRNADGNRYSVSDERSVRRGLQRLFSDDQIQLVAQNGNFDAYWLWYKDRLRVRRVWFDTLLAHHTLYPGAPHDLGFLTTQYTTHPYYKNERVLWRETSEGRIEDFWVYNVKDCCITLAVALAEMKELQREGLDKFFLEHVMRAQPHLTAMTVCGVKLDAETREKFDEEYGAKVNQLEDEFYKAVEEATSEVGYHPNPRSTPQMRELFFTKLRLTGRGRSTDDDNRTHMLSHPATTEASKRVLIAHGKYKEEHKFYSTYVKMRVDPDSRIRTEYKQFGTTKAPGRLSSAGNMWGSGTNLQNQPPEARKMFVADPGYTWVYYDLSQAEARVVGRVARIAKWNEQFERARIDGKYDCHRALCAEMFKLPYDETPKKDVDENGKYTLRYIAKRCRHGLNYRMGPERLAEVTGLSLDEARRAYTLYHSITPELRRWWRELEESVKRDRKLVTPFGRVWRLLGRFDPTDAQQLESIVAFVPQSTIGDKNTQVTYQAQEDDEWPHDARVVLNVHDSLTALAPFDKAKTAARILKKYAEQPIYIRGEPLVIPAEVKWTPPSNEPRRWSDLVPMEL